MSVVLLRFLWQRSRFGVLACWILPILIGSLAGVVYPLYAKEREIAEKLLSTFKFAARFFGNEQLSMLRPRGAFCLPFQHPLTLILYALVGAVAALGLPAGERGRGGLDLLLATRLTRTKLVVTVGVFVAMVAPGVGLGAFVGSLIGARISGVLAEVPVLDYLLVAVNGAALAFALGSGALLISVLAPDRARALLGGGLILFAMLGLDVTARFTGERAAWLTRLTPYGYFRPVSVLSDRSIVLTDALPLLLIGVTLIGVSAGCARMRSRA